ncbi:MAG: carbohydrate kinase family protein [Deltaproteobacteria bacterium]|nr:carbohydrate kinase family protein [Deltaproteobacteria bacterium]MBW2447151.1 carbohydrate kinase family protein [Deltaproteobacteria bacterium]
MGESGPLWPAAAREDARFDVVGLGECALDHVGTLADGLPKFAGKVPLVGYEQMPGGQVATAMHGAARLGLRAGFIGAVGDDDAGRRVLAPLEAAGVDVSQVKRVGGAATQLSMILIDRKSGERTLVWHRDPRLQLEAADAAPGYVTSARVLHLDTVHMAAATAAARAARGADVPVVLDADAPVEGLDALLPHVDFPIVSQSFAEVFSGDVSVSTALDALVRGGARMAVVTLGEEGAVARVGDRLIRSPGYEVAARDTTGAGDAFRAGFLLGLLAGQDAEGALRWAHATAALNCTGLGAQGGLPSRAGLDAFLAEQRPRPWREPASVRI